MTSIQDQKRQLYQQRLQQQSETNSIIFELINQAKSDEKKYLPFGPILMNIYNQQINDESKFKLQKQAQQTRNKFCQARCKSQQNCKPICQTHFNTALNYGMQHFSKIYKYSYLKTVKQEQ